MTNRRLPPVLPAAEERALSVAAEVDPRTLRRALHGLPVLPLLLGRIRAALHARGKGHLLTADAPVAMRSRPATGETK